MIQLLFLLQLRRLLRQMYLVLLRRRRSGVACRVCSALPLSRQLRLNLWPRWLLFLRLCKTRDLRQSHRPRLLLGRHQGSQKQTSMRQCLKRRWSQACPVPQQRKLLRSLRR